VAYAPFFYSPDSPEFPHSPMENKMETKSHPKLAQNAIGLLMEDHRNVQKMFKDYDKLLDEAEVEHAGAKALIEPLGTTHPRDDLFDAKVTVLGEYISHHVKEEQDELFPEVRKAKLDLDTLGQEMLKRKHALQSEMGLAQASDGEDKMPLLRPAASKRKKPAAAVRK